MDKLAYGFGSGRAHCNAGMKHLLGGKGANLAEMTAMGLPVPPGFTITTEVCNRYLADRRLSDELKTQVRDAVGRVETEIDARFGDAARPLLLSCRSGARGEYARHDGYGAEYRLQRRDCGCAGTNVGRSTIRLGQRPPLREDVWRSGPGRAAD
jgi:hypothetical protein